MGRRGPDVPLVATADGWFRVSLLQHPTEPTKSALVVFLFTSIAQNIVF